MVTCPSQSETSAASWKRLSTFAHFLYSYWKLLRLWKKCLENFLLVSFSQLVPPHRKLETSFVEDYFYSCIQRSEQVHPSTKSSKLSFLRKYNNWNSWFFSPSEMDFPLLRSLSLLSTMIPFFFSIQSSIQWSVKFCRFFLLWSLRTHHISNEREEKEHMKKPLVVKIVFT